MHKGNIYIHFFFFLTFILFYLSSFIEADVLSNIYYRPLFEKIFLKK